MKNKPDFLKILLALLIASLAARPLGAYIAEGRRSVKIYSRETGDLETKKAAAGFFSALAKSPPAWSAALTLKTAVSLKTEKRASLCDVLPLAVSSAALPAAGQSAGGWRAMGKAYGWLPDGRPEKLVISFSSSALSAQALTEFDELWIDYQDLFPRAPVTLSAQISAEIRDYSGGAPKPFTAFAAAGQTVLFPAARLEPAKAAWLPKNYFYSLGRYLREKPDENWRYVGLNDMTVIQRRLHTEITGLEYLDFVFAPGAEPVGVNVRLAARDNYSSGLMVELGALPAVQSPDGTTWRLNLPSLLRGRFAGKDKVFLQEIIVFVKGPPGIVAPARPLEQVVFQKLGNQEEDLASAAGKIQPARARTRPELLPARFTALNGSITRMIVDLRPLRNRGEAFFKSGKLFLAQENPAAFSAVSVSGLRLVSLCDAEIPAYYGYGESFLKRWGGGNLNPLSAEDGVEWPVMRAYFPFSVLNAKLPSPKPAPALLSEKQMRALLAFPVETREPVVTGSLPFVLRDRFQREEYPVQAEASVRPEDHPRMTVSDRGVTFLADKPFTKAQSSEGFALEGEGRHLQFSLPLPAELKPGTRLFLSMPEGAESVLSTKLTAVFEDGEFNLYINPNRPEALGRAGRLKSLRFKLALTGGRYRLKFNELALFDPVLQTGSEALNQKLPSVFSDYPVAEGILAPAGALTSTVNGLLRGSLVPGHGGPAALSWRAPARRPIDWLKGVSFSYRVPQRAAAANPCWLRLTIAGDKAKITGDLCPNGAEGRIFVTPSDISDGRADIGKFLGASYKINFGDLGISPDKDFEFGMAYEGYAMSSVADAFVDWPVALAGGENLNFAKNVSSLRDLVEKRLWLGGDAQAVGKLAAAGGRLAPAARPWFQLDAAVVEPLETFPREAWEKLTFQPGQPAPGGGIPFKLLKLALYAGAAVLAWRGAKKAPWRIFRTFADSIFSFLLALAKTAAMFVWGKAQSYFPAANKVVLFAALGPGLWYAGGLSGPAAAAAALSFVVLGAGAYWHSRRNTGQAGSAWWFGAGSCLPPFLRYLGAAAALFAVWTAGRARLAPAVKWHLLPVLAVGYFFLPWLSANAAEKIKLCAAVLRREKVRTLTVVWSVIASALYGTGLRLPAGGGENYYFTFGALAVTFAVRYLVAALLPLLRRFSSGLAEDIGADPAKPYFAAAILGLAATAVLVATGLQPIAEQTAIAVYYCLVIGVFKEGRALYKTRSEAPPPGV